MGFGVVGSAGGMGGDSQKLWKLKKVEKSGGREST
jgi:hypothetical protein